MIVLVETNGQIETITDAIKIETVKQNRHVRRNTIVVTRPSTIAGDPPVEDDIELNTCKVTLLPQD